MRSDETTLIYRACYVQKFIHQNVRQVLNRIKHARQTDFFVV